MKKAGRSLQECSDGGRTDRPTASIQPLAN